MTAITAENGKACIELIREVTPDLLILDLVMPEADGFQVLSYLRGRPQYENLPVIIVTAKDLDGKEWRTLKEHVCSVLDKKNLSKDNLIMSIDRCIGGSQIKLKTENETSPAQVNGADGKPPSLPLILVIEDNPDNMTTIQAVLRKDYRVIGAEDGETGLRRALAEKPDLILLDISLPGIDGVTLAKTIKTMAPIRGIPLVALTAQAMKGDREKFLNAGCDEYVSKPFDPQKLMATIGMILSGPTKREEEA
jgi:CheY-like chemotaxis protein